MCWRLHFCNFPVAVRLVFIVIIFLYFDVCKRGVLQRIFFRLHMPTPGYESCFLLSWALLSALHVYEHIDTHFIESLAVGVQAIANFPRFFFVSLI